MARARRGDACALEVEEEVMGIIAEVLSAAHGRSGEPREHGQLRSGWVELADAARVEILRTVDKNTSVEEVALAAVVAVAAR